MGGICNGIWNNSHYTERKFCMEYSGRDLEENQMEELRDKKRPDIKIIVAAHKPYAMPKDGIYVPVQVGSAGKESIQFARDDSGDNISERNPKLSTLLLLHDPFFRRTYLYSVQEQGNAHLQIRTMVYPRCHLKPGHHILSFSTYTYA